MARKERERNRRNWPLRGVAIRQFEEIESWQLARQFACEIYRVSNRGEFRRDFMLRDQLRRACISIMANIAEGFGRKGKNDFVHFLTIAQASALEVQSHLYIALDLGYIPKRISTFSFRRRSELNA